MKKFGVLLSYLFMILIVLLVAVVMIVMVGADVGVAFSSFFSGIIGSSYAISEVFVKATPLILAGLGVAVGFRSGFTNIGAEGQLYMGAIAAACIALGLKGLPAIIMIPLILLAGFLFGGVWSLIPGVLKARFGISDVINTIMFNFIAIGVVGILLRSVLKDPNNPFPMSETFPQAATMPQLLGSGERVHAGIIIALIAAFLVWLLVWRTPRGFEMRAVGLNPRACQCSGISVNKNIVISSIISGGLAGLAGVCEVTGLHNKMLEGISVNYGYIAVIVALLGQNHPLGVIISALGIAALQVGALSMQRSAGVPTSISSILMGTVVLLILARRIMFNFLLKEKKEVAAE